MELEVSKPHGTCRRVKMCTRITFQKHPVLDTVVPQWWLCSNVSGEEHQQAWATCPQRSPLRCLGAKIGLQGNSLLWLSSHLNSAVKAKMRPLGCYNFQFQNSIWIKSGMIQRKIKQTLCIWRREPLPCCDVGRWRWWGQKQECEFQGWAASARTGVLTKHQGVASCRRRLTKNCKGKSTSFMDLSAI